MLFVRLSKVTVLNLHVIMMKPEIKLPILFQQRHTVGATVFKVAVGPNLSTNKHQTNYYDRMYRTAIFQLLLWPQDISELAERERAYTIIIQCIYFYAESITLAIIWPEIVKKRYNQLFILARCCTKRIQ